LSGKLGTQHGRQTWHISHLDIQMAHQYGGTWLDMDMEDMDTSGHMGLWTYDWTKP
jgi:hypothetical protein